jgi:hypothetical protein
VADLNQGDTNQNAGTQFQNSIIRLRHEQSATGRPAEQDL